MITSQYLGKNNCSFVRSGCVWGYFCYYYGVVGVIQNQEIKILVDSGSSHTFISSQLAASLTGIESVHSSMTVQVANGSKLQCVEHIPQASWSLSGYSFWSNLKILPLSGYDMILGLDWLQCYSPMKVHWGQKSMLIPYKGTTILLCGMIMDQWCKYT